MSGRACSIVDRRRTGLCGLLAAEAKGWELGGVFVMRRFLEMDGEEDRWGNICRESARM